MTRQQRLSAPTGPICTDCGRVSIISPRSRQRTAFRVRKGVYRPTLTVAAAGSVTNALERATTDIVRTAAVAATVRRNLAYQWR
jgi:hypothetical protein